MLHPTISVSINERDVLKLVLGFLEDRRFHIAQLALERSLGLKYSAMSNSQFLSSKRRFNFHLENLKKPKLEAQWNEQILATPIKPHGQFPYSFVPHTKLKCAQEQFSQSMSASMAFDPGFYRNSSKEKCDRLNFRAHSMSQSTFPSIGVFSIQRLVSNGNGGGDERPHSLGNDAMRQSQIISDMLSESSAPSTARRSPQSAGRQKNTVDLQSCSQDKTIRFWDLRASSATSVIWPAQKTSNSPVTSVCVDPSGKLLISGHEDATIMHCYHGHARKFGRTACIFASRQAQ